MGLTVADLLLGNNKARGISYLTQATSQSHTATSTAPCAIIVEDINPDNFLITFVQIVIDDEFFQAIRICGAVELNGLSDL